MKKIKQLLCVALVALAQLSVGQFLSITNPSLEGQTCAACAPAGWQQCFGSPDIQPGQWDITQQASCGTSYVSFLASADSTNLSLYEEGISQQLPTCMQAGQSYTFYIDIAFSPIYLTAEPLDCYGSLMVLGGTSACDNSNPLWSSGIITHTNWQTYTVTFTPNQNFCYLILKPYAISPCGGYINAMIDNIRNSMGESLDINLAINDAFIADSLVNPVTQDSLCFLHLSGTIDTLITPISVSGNFPNSPIMVNVNNNLVWDTIVPVYPNSSSYEIVAYLEQFVSGCDWTGPTDTVIVSSTCKTVGVNENEIDVLLNQSVISLLQANLFSSYNVKIYSFDGSLVGQISNANPQLTLTNASNGFYFYELEATYKNKPFRKVDRVKLIR